MQFRSTSLAISLICNATLLAASVVAEGQLGAQPTFVPMPGGDDQFLLVQRTADDRIVLTPNECFFPSLGLSAEGIGDQPDVGGLNKGSSFAEIRGWDDGEVAEWGLLFENPGEISVRASVVGRGKFSVSIGDETTPLDIGQSKILTIHDPGLVVLKLRCDRSSGDVGVRRITIGGPAARGAAVVRKRWRPAAAHARFFSSEQPDSVRLWVMQMDAVPADLGFYCPITTPFGYYGPSWNADGTVNASFNFSLWSYGRNQPEPPVHRLSHLIAVGDPRASFGGFGHEGTGVKIRDWQPLAGRQGQRQAIALRVQPGEDYDTYHSYFYASDTRSWQLFGSGKKFNDGKPLESLWVGSFVEVPGRAAVQRSGVYPRRMKYRGWVMDAEGQWYSLDRMTNGDIDRETGLTHSNRGATDDGWFYLETGGWSHRYPPNQGNDVALRGTPDAAHQDFLSEEKLRALQTIPSEIGVVSVADGVQVHFRVSGAGQSPRATVYWGSEDGLTFPMRWEHSLKISDIAEGRNQVKLSRAGGRNPSYVRLLLENDAGKFWSTQTFVVQP